VHDEPTGQWVSFAEHAWRQPQAQELQAIAQTRDAATAAQPAALALLPPGWHTAVGEPSHCGCYTLDLHPPARPVDLYAYLVPPYRGHDWRVRVYNRTAGVCRALFTPGTATAATYPDVPAAVDAVRSATTASASVAGRHGQTP